MTEKEFDKKIEDMASRFEYKLETAAGRLDKGVTRRYGESRLFRFLTRGISAAAGLGLLAGAKHLSDRGCKTAAVWCAGLGLLGFTGELLRLFIVRRKK